MEINKENFKNGTTCNFKKTICLAKSSDNVEIIECTSKEGYKTSSNFSVQINADIKEQMGEGNKLQAETYLLVYSSTCQLKNNVKF
jgi:hypothetical protein